MNCFKQTLLVALAAAIWILPARAQAPETIIVAASPTVAPLSSPATKDSEPQQEIGKILEEMKAVNAELIRKQEATLQQLDELQKAAEQLKIFSKRG